MARRKSKAVSASQAKGKDSEDTQIQTRVGISSLPIEILDIVFEHSPKSTLLVCTRVSRLWRDYSRPHLFASLTISRNSSYDDLLIFLDANTDIARYVRNLTLGRGHTAWLNGDNPLVSRKLLVELTRKLPRLQELRLRDVKFDTRPSDTSTDAEGPASRDEEPEQPPLRLEIFSMERCWRSGIDVRMPVDVLLDTLSALAPDSIYLSSLSISFRQWAHHASGHQPRPINPRCLFLKDMPSNTSFHDSLSNRPLYEALIRVTVPNCLRKLRACHVDRHDALCLAALGDFLSHAAQDSLQDFVLPFSICHPIVQAEGTPERWNALSLHKCRNLESFGISFNMRTGLNNTPVYPCIPYSAVAIAILSHLPPTLRHLTIELLYVETAEEIKNRRVLGLRALDDALAERFPALETVRLVLRAKYFLLEYTMAAFKTMPKCKKRGILEVVHSPEN